MIFIKDHKQLEIFDPWSFLGDKRRRMLENDWPGLFREHILSELPVNEMRPFFDKDFGRPSKEVHTALGVMLLQQTMDLTDLEAMHRLAFDIRWHYAFNIADESDRSKYISEKTIWTVRQIMTENNIDQVMLDRVTSKLAKVFNVDTDKQRLDSVHIKSNMRKLGRVTIFAKTIRKFLVNLKRHHRTFFDTIPEEVRARYFTQKSMQAFSMVKPSETDKSLQILGKDLFDLIESFKDRPEVCSMNTYKLMERVLREQCHVNVENEGDLVIVKQPKEIPSDSLQNPSDPDASYSGHKGQGYQVQIMETYTQTDDSDEKARTLNLITSVHVETACAHDSAALLPAITDAQRQDLGPRIVLADSLYGSDDNVGAAQTLEVEVVAPAMPGSRGGGLGLEDFRFDEQGRIVSCPSGFAPDQVKYKKKNQRHIACFELDHCAVCPLAAQCPAQLGRKYRYLRYSEKDHRLAERRAFEKTDAFIDVYRMRAGIEATMSQYDRLTGVKQLRIRGLLAVRFCATLKAAGLNLLRAAAVKMARTNAKIAENDLVSSKKTLLLFFKDQLGRIFSFEKEFWPPIPLAADSYQKLAA